MADSFIGDWRVREYAYDGAGAYLGSVRQRRRLERVSDARLRVSQDCEPDADLSGTPMAQFRGHHEFELDVAGRIRHYRGPAVVGRGVAFGDGVMLGRGVWPEFGHNFRSFSALTEPARQLTGGAFYRATRLTANIVGVAGPADAGEPTLSGAEWPGDVATTWRGTRSVVAANGSVGGDCPAARSYGPGSWRDDAEVIELEVAGNAVRVSGALVGLAVRVGPMLELEAVTADGATVHERHLLDAERSRLVCIRRVIRDETLDSVEVLRLHSEEAP